MSALPTELQMIPMDRIEVLNPRERNNRIFEVIVDNIKTLGLKKPVTVTPRPGPEGDVRYMLICGEGRLKAFKALGETQIPALVVNVNDEDAFIMSLAENIPPPMQTAGAVGRYSGLARQGLRQEGDCG